MGCTNKIPPNFTQCAKPTNYNRNVLEYIMQLPDFVRKEIRLLAKQFEITGLEKEPDIMFGNKIIEKGKHIIEYREFGGEEYFEMIIKENNDESLHSI